MYQDPPKSRQYILFFNFKNIHPTDPNKEFWKCLTLVGVCVSVCMAEQELEDEMPNFLGVCVSVCMAEQELED